MTTPASPTIILGHNPHSTTPASPSYVLSGGPRSPPPQVPRAPDSPATLRRRYAALRETSASITGRPVPAPSTVDAHGRPRAILAEVNAAVEQLRCKRVEDLERGRFEPSAAVLGAEVNAEVEELRRLRELSGAVRAARGGGARMGTGLGSTWTVEHPDPVDQEVERLRLARLLKHEEGALSGLRSEHGQLQQRALELRRAHEREVREQGAMKELKLCAVCGSGKPSRRAAAREALHGQGWLLDGHRGTAMRLGASRKAAVAFPINAKALSELRATTDGRNAPERWELPGSGLTFSAQLVGGVAGSFRSKKKKKEKKAAAEAEAACGECEESREQVVCTCKTHGVMHCRFEPELEVTELELELSYYELHGANSGGGW